MSIEMLEKELGQESKPNEQVEAAKEQPKVDSKPADSTPKDDPEFDLGVDEKGQPMKFKRSQILEFQKGSMLQKDYTIKTQEIAAQKKDLEEMFKIVEHLKANPKKAEKVIAILDEKAEVAEEKKDDIDEILKTLPDDDPYARVLKAQKVQLQGIIDQNKKLKDKLDGYEKKTQAVEENESVKQAGEALTKALENNFKDLKFEDDDDKKECRQAVLTYIVNNQKEYKDEADFLETMKQAVAQEYKALTARNERVTARYIKSKGGPSSIPLHPGGPVGKPMGEKPNMDNLQAVLEDELNKEKDKG